MFFSSKSIIDYTETVNQQHPETALSIKGERKCNLSSEVLNCYKGSNREMFCDFTVVVEDREFPCHRFVLNACSGFFEALLRSDMKERRENRVAIQGISPDTFELILDAIYTGSDVRSLETIQDIWKAAHQLQIKFLVQLCEDFIKENLNERNAYEMYTWAQLLSSENIVNFILTFMATQCYSFDSATFAKIKYEDFRRIMQIQKSTGCVDFKIETILKWCCQKDNVFSLGTERLQLLSTLFKEVDLAQASNECLATIMTNKCVLANTEVITAVNFHASKKLVEQNHLLRGYYLMRMDKQVERNANCAHCMKT
ncbi:kelch-like protein 40b [Biomphalaria glabrata]|nr:kelch-like protein 40b [Biomphalaria glabrata]